MEQKFLALMKERDSYLQRFEESQDEARKASFESSELRHKMSSLESTINFQRQSMCNYQNQIGELEAQIADLKSELLKFQQESAKEVNLTDKKLYQQLADQEAQITQLKNRLEVERAESLDFKKKSELLLSDIKQKKNIMREQELLISNLGKQNKILQENIDDFDRLVALQETELQSFQSTSIHASQNKTENQDQITELSLRLEISEAQKLEREEDILVLVKENEKLKKKLSDKKD